jgi:hypothetical protein
MDADAISRGSAALRRNPGLGDGIPMGFCGVADNGAKSA